MRRVVPFVLTGLLAGCADQLAARQAYLGQFVGQPEGVVVQAMGVPTRNYETGGVKYLAYNEHRIDIIPTFPRTARSTPAGMAAASRRRSIELQCETTFEVADGT